MNSPLLEGATVAPQGVGRLLAAWTDSAAPADLQAHRARYGPVPRMRRGGLVEVAQAAGLRGRGGGGFPTARKLAAVAAWCGRPGGRAVVVANGCESEPASGKDAVLLTVAPHLVLDGAVLAARAVGADRIVVCVHAGVPATAVTRAARERTDGVAIEVEVVPAGYVSGQESALVHLLNTGTATPTTTPPRPSDRGVGGRPTLVDNVETLAHLALIARYGADWFRTAGTADRPGTQLVTIGGAVRVPAVYELDTATPVDAVIGRAGGPTGPLHAVLAGGYGGIWLPADDDRPIGEVPGVAVLMALPATACGPAQTAHLLRYLADESAGQCGPCRFGLPAVADDVAEITAAGPAAHAAMARLRRRLAVIPGRGACAHPDGAVRMAASALDVFAADLAAHLDGRPCPGSGVPPLFPLPPRRPR